MKGKKTMFFLILILTSNISLAFSATNEGYGEDSQSLGQFVDSYDNLNNVSVSYQVERNTTLNAMELNYSATGGGGVEDLTTWIEDDGDGDLTVIPAKVTFTTMRRDSDSLIYKDSGVGTIGDFEIDFTLQLTDLEAGDLSDIIQMWAFAIGDGDTRVDLFANDGLWVALQQKGNVDDQFRYRLRWWVAGGFVVDVFDATYYGLVTHYLTLIRTGVNITLNIYTDEARTVQIKHYSSVGGNADSYRYYCASIGYDVGGDPADHASGNVRDIGLGMGAGYVDTGYFTSTDYLSDPIANGSILVQMTNTTIPTNTIITVEFSNDNATWILNDWEPIFGGFESIDLRILNYSTAYYIRYNLTTTDSTVTPRIYQSRLITTIGNSTGGGGVVNIYGINSATILMLILLFALAILVYLGIKKR